MKFHFAWSLYSIGIVYGLMTIKVVDILPFSFTLGVLIGLYSIFLLLSTFCTEEPLEK